MELLEENIVVGKGFEALRVHVPDFLVWVGHLCRRLDLGHLAPDFRKPIRPSLVAILVDE
jgi:hypothetical protein